MKKILCYLLISINLMMSCSSQNTSTSDTFKNFTKEFFMNQNVYRALKKYARNNTIQIIDPDHNIINEFTTFNNNNLNININIEKQDDYDFYVKKAIINKHLAFVVLWYKDSTTALCFYPIKSEYTPNKWIVEEITTKSIK
ncbi:hypothetical protein [Chryseobacterium angstadtii]|nr:hypothetical protein [Chryseobacterium angstadtii]